jgi:hypothetical protein
MHKTHSRAIWRRRPESNRPTRICNPVHNRFVTAPKLHLTSQYFSSSQDIDVSLFHTKKGSLSFPFYSNWSGKRVSNSRPQPWQGCALPTELFPRFDIRIIAYFFCFFNFFKLMFDRFSRCRLCTRQTCCS